MPETLKAIITQTETRPVVVDECVELVEAEVQGKGLIIRGAFKTVKKIKPGFVKGAIDGLLDDWLEKIEPYYGSWQSDTSSAFSAHLTSKKREVANDLLKVTDERAESSKHKTAAKMYRKLRPSALNNVETAVPGLAALIGKHL
ncbi:MAG: hypothetical protein GY811_21815 [Myxococcales bacterium]|nr:hypothetical protein [Myxococcales bacterium]